MTHDLTLGLKGLKGSKNPKFNTDLRFVSGSKRVKPQINLFIPTSSRVAGLPLMKAEKFDFITKQENSTYLTDPQYWKEDRFKFAIAFPIQKIIMT